MIRDELGPAVARKDGRRLYFDKPLKDEDFIEFIEAGRDSGRGRDVSPA